MDDQMGFMKSLIFNSGRNKVKILLDLDGTVVPEGLPNGDYEIFKTNGYAAWKIRTRVLEWIEEKLNDSRVELVWSTTWQHMANTILEERGLEPIESIDFDSTYQLPDDWYKSDGLKLYSEDNPDPIVIVDNELPDRFFNITSPRFLLIKPDSLQGVSDEELARIDKFVDDYSNRKIKV